MRFILLILAALLSSCIEGDESVWINKDGSGRIEARYEMPEKFMAQLGGADSLEDKLRDAIDQDDSLELESIGNIEMAGRVAFQFAVTFKDLRKLSEFPKKHLRDSKNPGAAVPEEALFGDINLKLNGLLISLYREIDITPLLPDAAKKNPAFLGDSTFRYTVHLPIAPTQHDAHHTSNEGKSLTWTYLLREHTNRPMTIWASGSFPLPWWIWLSLTLISILFLLLVIWAVKYTITMRA